MLRKGQHTLPYLNLAVAGPTNYTNRILMQKQYRNGFLGWMFDAYLVQVIVAPLQYNLTNKSDLYSLFLLLIMLAIFIVSILYHVTWKHQTQWISPGEHLIGTQWIDGFKVQTNPYPISRFFLIVVIVLNLLLTANTIEDTRIYFGYSSISFQIFFNLVYNGLLLYGTLSLGMARKSGLVLISAAYALIATAYLFTLTQALHPGLGQKLKNILIVFAANILIGGYYLYRHKRAQRSPTMV
jgi:hypothetical protein